jgi:amidase
MPPPGRDYTKFLEAGALKGARIGIPRAFFYDKITPPGGKEPRGGVNADQAKVMAEAIAVLEQQGAVIVDPADIPSIVDKDQKNSFLSWNICSGWSDAKGKDADCSVSFKYGMKRDFNKWLASLGPSAPVKTLTPRPARSSTANRTSTSPTKWTSRPTAPATKPTAPRTSR